MAYTYRNKKTGEVIYLNRRVKTAFWEEVEPEEETTGDETPEEETTGDETPEEETPEINEISGEAMEEAPKKTTRKRGK